MPAEGEEEFVDNHAASVRDKLVIEKKKLDALYDQGKGRFEDTFILQRVRAEELFSSQPVQVVRAAAPREDRPLLVQGNQESGRGSREHRLLGGRRQRLPCTAG